MLTYSFQDRNGESLYEYLYTRIKEDILSGRLKAGEKLPSKRSLAENLDIWSRFSTALSKFFEKSVEKNVD